MKKMLPQFPVSIVAEKTGYAPRQILYKIRRGKIKATKVGWIWMIAEDEIQRIKEMKKGGKEIKSLS